MCGIAGFSGKFEADLLGRMNATIEHRGPDDDGTCFMKEHGIGLAHRRLSIIDLSPLGHQPMWDTTRRAAIIFNGEIYNYRELREELVASGLTFQSHSDTEVLLNLYLRDGHAMLSRLNGIFAFAIWDVRTQELFMARDGLGVKPLYLAETAKGVLFASEIKALLEECSLDRSIDSVAVRSYLTYLWSPAPRTMLRSVKKLEPGHALMVRDGRITRKWQFYDLPYSTPADSMSESQAIELVRETLSKAVCRQMVADVPVGAFLSGGVDSSAIVSIARTHARDGKLRCFTIGFKERLENSEGMAEDQAYAELVAKHLGVEIETIIAGPEMVQELERMVYHLDEPTADPAALHVFYITRLARERGIKVMLSGTGADDIFTGYRRHYALMQERYWAWLPAQVRQLLRSGAGCIPVAHPVLRRMQKAFQYADLDGDARIASYFMWANPEWVSQLFGPSFRAGLEHDHDEDPLRETLSHLDESVLPLQRMLYIEGKHFLADHNLNYMDKMSMANGVETRVPFLDIDLVNTVVRLPQAFKQRGRIGKWILKEALKDQLPREVLYRVKTGFGVPLRHWIRNDLRPVVEDVLSSESLGKRALFNPCAVRDLIEANRRGRIDGTYIVFSLLCIELWCRIFLDGKQSSL